MSLVFTIRGLRYKYERPVFSDHSLITCRMTMEQPLSTASFHKTIQRLGTVNISALLNILFCVNTADLTALVTDDFCDLYQIVLRHIVNTGAKATMV